jgi:HPP family.
VLIGFVTYLSNQLPILSFLLFPPLAAGTYTLFSDPEGRYASPIRFISSLSVGALCGLIATVITQVSYIGGDGAIVQPGSAALAIFLTGVVTWFARIEAPSAFSTALLTLITGDVEPVTYVLSIMLASVVIAVVFVIWRDEFYEQRAQYLYETVQADDHVLIPMRGDHNDQTALFGAQIAAAHETGKVVLLDTVSGEDPDSEQKGLDNAEIQHQSRQQNNHQRGQTPDEDIESSSNTVQSNTAGEDGVKSGIMAKRNPQASIGKNINANENNTDTNTQAEQKETINTVEAVDRLEQYVTTIETQVGIPCDTVVATGDPVSATSQTAETANCDLVVMPYEEENGNLSPYVQGVFKRPIDAIAFRSETTVNSWQRILVFVVRDGDTAHGMIDFATRLAGREGMVSVTTCISRESERRDAETRLDQLVETVDVDVDIETRVARSSIEQFMSANADSYNLVMLGSSGDRSVASRFISPPTFEQIHTIDIDVAVFDPGRE